METGYDSNSYLDYFTQRIELGSQPKVEDDYTFIYLDDPFSAST